MDGPSRLSFGAIGLATLFILIFAGPLLAQTTAPARSRLGYAALAGKKIEDVRIMGNAQTSSAIILNVVRTKTGDLFDPVTVEEDYQRIYGLKKFANVEAKVEPTTTGVIVTFIVAEQKQIKEIRFHGNTRVDTDTLKNTVDVHPGEAIDAFRISIARQAIESLYKSKNFPYAHVTVDRDQLARTGILVFAIVEGPNVKVRKVDFTGNKSFSDDRLRDEVHTKFWIWIFRPGTFDPDTVDDDVALLRHYYESKGFFDVRVGRKITESADQTEIKVTYLIEEGARYRVDKVIIRGNKTVSTEQLLAQMKMTSGQYFDAEALHRDIREVVRAYGPSGFIYVPGSNNPDYLRIGNPMYPFGIQTIFHREAGKVDLLYDISEGKPFKVGRIIVKGNTKTQDKVVLREMRMAPGQKYDSAKMSDATERLRTSPYFSNVSMTPTGEDPNIRDLVVEVTESRTATFGLGAGINSNGGLGGNITYEQRNFDIGNFPDSWEDVFSDRAFVGAGQNLRISLEPGTQATNASIRFTEPWLFDQPYSFTSELYYRNRVREDWDETRTGGRVTLGKRFDYIYSTSLTLRAEDVKVHDLGTDAELCNEIREFEGHNTLTSTILQGRRDTTNHGALPYRGTNSTLAWESYGAMGGEFTFQKFTGSFDYYKLLNEDLLDRKTILSLRGDAGWIWGSSPFFERFYAGGIGTIRGFQFRGVSPRCEDAPGELPIGGDFSMTGSAEIGFPLYGDNLRGVVFVDAGTVEPEFGIGTIRSGIGFGIRLTLPVFQAPVALDFALPMTKDSQDDTQWFSFSLGIVP